MSGMRIVYCVALWLGLLLAAPFALAETIVHEQLPDTNQLSYFSNRGGQQMVDDFVLGANADIGQIRWWGHNHIDQGANDADLTNDGIYVDLDRNGEVDPETERIGPDQGVWVAGTPTRFEVGP